MERCNMIWKTRGFLHVWIEFIFSNVECEVLDDEMMLGLFDIFEDVPEAWLPDRPSQRLTECLTKLVVGEVMMASET